MAAIPRGVGLAVTIAAVLGALTYRRWHLRWGATDAEVQAPMPGDGHAPHAPFSATRAITIAAPPHMYMVFKRRDWL